jgi:hypothetical protein
MINMIIIIFINLFHHPFFNGFHSVSLFFLCMSCLFTSFYPCPGPAGALLRIVQAVLSAQQWLHRVIRLHLRQSDKSPDIIAIDLTNAFNASQVFKMLMEMNGIIGIRRKCCSLSLRSRWSRF